MNDFQAVINFFQGPTGRMILNAIKDVAVNHVIPHYRNSMTRPVDMSAKEQERRAQEEFATVDEFDIDMSTDDHYPPGPQPDSESKDKGKI
ncbi:TPA: hypothetical protein PXM28_001486 [Yersinia enterocolitica]|nr:hypothetical protein [Yersinia enterocolitica]